MQLLPSRCGGAMADRKIAVVTGGNRGLGLETCRQLGRLGWHVLLTARDLKAGAAALKGLQAEGLSAELRKLDVTAAEDAQALARHLRETLGGLDVLVNNAGIGPPEGSPLTVSPVTLMEILNTNTL